MPEPSAPAGRLIGEMVFGYFLPKQKVPPAEGEKSRIMKRQAWSVRKNSKQQLFVCESDLHYQSGIVAPSHPGARDIRRTGCTRTARPPADECTMYSCREGHGCPITAASPLTWSPCSAPRTGIVAPAHPCARDIPVVLTIKKPPGSRTIPGALPSLATDDYLLVPVLPSI